MGPSLLDSRARFPEAVAGSLEQLAEISGWLRKERELAFYGDMDFIPTERYLLMAAQRAITDAVFVVDAASRVIKTRS